MAERRTRQAAMTQSVRQIWSWGTTHAVAASPFEFIGTWGNMMDLRYSRPLTSVSKLALLSATLATTPNVQIAHAQGTQAAQGGLEEIVVTARKRAENLQSVPLAITALTSDFLESAGVQSLRDIAYLTSGLTIQGSGAEASNAPVIRGLSFTGDTAQEINTSVFLDGIYISNSSAISLGLIDVERIEVVKGPQSALYGRNSFAGAINYVTKAPGEDFSGRVEATGGTDGKLRAVASVGGPVVEGKFGARLVAGYDHFDGTWKDPVNSAKMGGYEKRDGMLTAVATPSDTFTVDGSIYYGDDNFGLVPRAAQANNCALAGAAFLQFCGKVPDGDDTAVAPQRPVNRPEFASGNTREVFQGRIKTAWDTEVAKIEFLGGYFNVDAHNFNEFNARRNGLNYALIPGPGTVQFNVFFGAEFDNEDYSGELRFSSPEDQRLRWTFGGFYFHTDQSVFVHISADQNLIPAGQRVGGLVALWLTPGAVPTSNNTETVGSGRQWSGFSGADFDITDELTASAELRYTSEHKNQDILRNATTPGTDPDGPGGKEKTWKFWDTRLTLNYEVSEDSTLYVSAAKGTKAGGFNQRALIASEIGFEPERNWTYELGSKNTFLDGALRANLALFYIDWTDLQVSGPSDDPRTVGFITKNFGSVKAKGFDLDVAASLGGGITFNGSLALSNPKFQDDAFDFGAVATCRLIPACAPRVVTSRGLPAVSLDGYQRVRSSKWTGAGGLEIVRPLSGDWEWFARADYSYQSKQYQNSEEFFWIGSRHTGNLRAGVQTEQYRISAWLENVFDDQTPYQAGGNLRLTDFVTEQIAEYPDKRTFGVTAVLNF